MLSPIQFASADAFLQHAQTTLLQDEAANGLMLGICIRLRDYPERILAAPFLFTIDREPHQIVLAAIMTPPHNLILHCAETCDPSILEMLAGHLIAQGWAIPGVLGPAAISERFAERWAQRTGCQARVHQRQRGFELRQVIPPLPAPGRFRPAELSDLPLLTEWARAFYQDALHEDLTLEQARAMTALKIDDRQLYVWDANEPVSMAAVGRPTPHGISVSFVYTPPRQRGRGYASNCVAVLSQHMLDEGYQFCTLFTDLANPVSNAIYQHIGYRPIFDYTEYHFEND
ncbi:predicted acetyltransferase [Longilinea arvoryzae]|uniref:Predicted acetyltransferase n=1 Tax=Longilinea arvoryzae TaxID=360412 RepID=A0A0S7BG87_9CHLR|nr:GNAT family N-acetyltransferase [Longilinea arvoryzae]GAP13510.1 predicted acetyltransferase [Longilinea arvoryzae]